MTTEFLSRDSVGWNTGLSIVVSAVAIFLVVYPAVVFLTGIRVVTLVYGLVPAVGSAVLIAGWAVQQGYSVDRLWLFALAFVSIGTLGLVVYRLIVEPLFFGSLYEVHYVFERFHVGARIGILGAITAVAYILAR